VLNHRGVPEDDDSYDLDYARHMPSEFVARQREEREELLRRDREELQELWREEVQTRRRERAPMFYRHAKRFGGDGVERG
jgi:hypothetical protein